MTNEIERKFLVKEMPGGLEKYPSNYISQGYLAVTGDGTEIRIRRKGNKYYETVKSGEGLSRKEAEVEIGSDAFHALWPLTGGKRVEKIRYEIPYGDHLIELDVYSGALDGLVVAEVEFGSEEESSRFTPPDWFGSEVTSDRRYANKSLALYGKPEE
jgi:CYTH domain-containing protein